MPVLAQQFRDVAVGIVEIAEVQRVGDAGIDAGRRCPRIDAGSNAQANAVIDAVDAKRAFLRDAETVRILASRFAAQLHRAVGKARRIDLEARLIRAGDHAIRAADAQLVVDSDDSVRPLPGRGRGTHLHARRLIEVLATDRREAAGDVRIGPGFDVEHLAPLHRRRGRIGVPACRRAGLAADAALEIGKHHPARHEVLSGVTLTLTRSALDPVASVSSSSIGISAFMLGASKSLATGVAQ